MFDKAIAHWTEESQLDMASEEAAELIVAINHFKRLRKKAEDNLLEEAIEVIRAIIRIERINLLLRLNWTQSKDFRGASL